MRFAAIILSVLVLALSVLPCTEYSGQSETATCQSDSGNADDCALCCSPFHACGSCAGFTIPTLIKIPAVVQIGLFHPSGFYQVTFVAFHTDAIWQPPKIA